METKELLKKVRKVEIKTRGLSNHIFSGEYHSAFKGRGMSFSEVREYQFGDDVRNIDWNVTARFDSPFIKVFEEERELTLILLVDISKSAFLGTKNEQKNQIITEICAVLSFSAINNNDKVGLLLFSEGIELYIPAKKGKSHILRIIRELLNFEPKGSTTNIAAAWEFFNSVIKKRSIVFMFSDFFADNYSKPLSLAARKHDVIGVKVQDQLDKKLPDVGIIQAKDIETGQLTWLDTSDKKIQAAYQTYTNNTGEYFKNAFTKNGCDTLEINTDSSYVNVLMKFFNMC
jgi:uncharacterized protein (DUF58 family)